MPLDPVLSAQAFSSLRSPVVLDCRPDPKAYEASHLAGAFHAQLERDLASPAVEPARGGRHPLPDPSAFCARLGRWGVNPSAHVVAYDDQGGANAAARLWWLVRALGHERVQVLDGGLAALRAEGHALTSELPPERDLPPYPASGFALPIADIELVERARRDPGARVLDVRAAFRYRGESEPIDPIAGHIAGAHNLPFAENLRADGTFKSNAELRELYDAALAGIPSDQLIVHCGSGVTACHALLALERAGLPGAKLYVGSWSEWCRNPDRAREPAEPRSAG